MKSGLQLCTTKEETIFLFRRKGKKQDAIGHFIPVTVHVCTSTLAVAADNQNLNLSFMFFPIKYLSVWSSNFATHIFSVIRNYCKLYHHTVCLLLYHNEHFFQIYEPYCMVSNVLSNRNMCNQRCTIFSFFSAAVFA